MGTGGAKSTCTKCGQIKPKDWPQSGTAAEEILNDVKKWPGLDACPKNEGGEHKFIVASVPGQPPRCEYCNIVMFNRDYKLIQVQVRSEGTGPGKVGPPAYVDWFTAKDNKEGSDRVLVEPVKESILKKIAQESVLRLWDERHDQWYELPYMEFDGSTFILNNRQLPFDVKAGTDIFVPNK
jgi:hypothetical protein